MSHFNKHTLERFFHWLLTRSIFRIPANVLSHGASHFSLFVIIFVSIFFYRKYLNEKEVIQPHTIDVHLGRVTDYNEKYRKDNIPTIPLHNVGIKLVLDNPTFRSHTNGKFSSGLEVSFDGKAVNRLLYYPNDEEYVKGGPQYKEVLLLDSVVLSVISNPRIENYSSAAYLDSIVGENQETFMDSLGYKVRKVQIHKVPDTQLDYATKMESDSSIVLSIAPQDSYKDSLLHKAYIFSDELGVKKDDPYYYYFISFHNVNFTGELHIAFDISGTAGSDAEMIRDYKGKNMQYNYIYPEPDRICNGKIEYFTEEKKQLIMKNRGVIIQAVDIDALNQRTQESFLLSVLFGTAVAFLLDIVIQLVRELRREQFKKA